MNKNMLDECIDLFMDTFSKEPWNDEYESRNQVETFFKNSFENNYFLGYVLIIDEKIKGISMGFKKAWLKGMEYYIDTFCIDYDLQGKGWGSLFIKQVEETISKDGLNAIILNTSIDYPAFDFYNKNSYKCIDDLRILAKDL